MLLHCVQAESRTPTVAALYGAHLTGATFDEAMARISAALPNANPRPALRHAAQTLTTSKE